MSAPFRDILEEKKSERDQDTVSKEPLPTPNTRRSKHRPRVFYRLADRRMRHSKRLWSPSNFGASFGPATFIRQMVIPVRHVSNRSWEDFSDSTESHSPPQSLVTTPKKRKHRLSWFRRLLSCATSSKSRSSPIYDNESEAIIQRSEVPTCAPSCSNRAFIQSHRCYRGVTSGVIPEIRSFSSPPLSASERTSPLEIEKRITDTVIESVQMTERLSQMQFSGKCDQLSSELKRVRENAEKLEQRFKDINILVEKVCSSFDEEETNYNSLQFTDINNFNDDMTEDCQDQEDSNPDDTQEDLGGELLWEGVFCRENPEAPKSNDSRDVKVSTASQPIDNFIKETFSFETEDSATLMSILERHLESQQNVLAEETASLMELRKQDQTNQSVEDVPIQGSSSLTEEGVDENSDNMNHSHF
jgi:hypothetical protein